MRIQLTRRVITILRAIGERGAPLRRAIEALQDNPRPSDAIFVAGYHQRHVRVGQHGYWLVWQVTQDRGETVVTVTAVEEN